MSQISRAPKTRRLIRVILGGIGRAMVTAIHVLGATIKALSGEANAPLIPPSTKPASKRQDYRP